MWIGLLMKSYHVNNMYDRMNIILLFEYFCV